MKDQNQENETYDTWLSKHGGYANSMTMRDHYAGLAMQADMGADWSGDVAHTVRQAWEVADAMIKARDAK